MGLEEPYFSVVVSPYGDALVTVGGEVDSNVEREFTEVVEEAVTHGHAGIIIDISRVTFFCSTGLNVLVRGLQSVGDGRPFVVQGASPEARRVFEITGLDTIFGLSSVHSSVDELNR